MLKEWNDRQGGRAGVDDDQITRADQVGGGLADAGFLGGLLLLADAKRQLRQRVDGHRAAARAQQQVLLVEGLQILANGHLRHFELPAERLHGKLAGFFERG